MCGITGRVDFQRDLSAEQEVTQAMTDTLACRGPDAGGTWHGRHAAIGHRRLAVIDLEGGRQPMVAEEEGSPLAVLSYCGEAYNFARLRRELESHGHRFRTASDTEVVLRAYLQWPDSFAGRLDGMFALAIWDVRREELILARDHLGIKPLCYARTPDGVLFGSEPKAILAHPRASRLVSADGLYEVLDMAKTPGSTAFSAIREVRPGHVIRVTAAGLQATPFWQLEAREHRDGLPETIRTVREMLEDTVRDQQVADVERSVLLSGGLDSSAVAALAAGILRDAGDGPVRTFSVDFLGSSDRFRPDAVRSAPDAVYAREMAAHAGAAHTEILLNSAELASPAVRTAVLRAVDMPPAFWGDMWPSLYLLFRAIRQHCTVALSGEGADELFGGYQWFRNPSALAADTFPWLTPGSARYFGGSSLLDRGLLNKLDVPGRRAARYRDAVAEVPVLPGEPETDRLMRRITYLNLTRFLQTLLDRKDRMSMAVGLEVRVPFCSRQLVEYVFNVPWRMKSFDGREKSLLRAAVADLLPVSIASRIKNPYPATQDPGYERTLRARLTDLLADSSSPVLPLLDLARARKAAGREVGPVSWPYDRGSVEMTLWLDQWLRSYTVTLDL